MQILKALTARYDQKLIDLNISSVTMLISKGLQIKLIGYKNNPGNNYRWQTQVIPYIFIFE